MNAPLTSTFKLNHYPLFAHLRRQFGVIGIYAIVNTEKGKAYIGSTSNFFSRWYKHFYELKGGYHGCLELQADYTANPDAFEFWLLEAVENTDGLMEREEWVAERFDVASLYNCRIGTRMIKGRYGVNANAPRPKRKGIRTQSKPRWYDGQGWRSQYATREVA